MIVSQWHQDCHNLKILWQQELESHIEVTVIYRRGGARCPRCGKVKHKEHDRRRQNKQGQENELFYHYPELGRA